MIDQNLANVPEEVQRRFREFGGANNPNPKYIDTGVPAVPVFEIQNQQRRRIMLHATTSVSVGLFTFQFTYLQDFKLWELIRGASYLEFQSCSITFTHGAGVNAWEFESHVRYLSDEPSPQTTQVALGQLDVDMIGTNHSTRYEMLRYPKVVPINLNVFDPGDEMLSYNLIEVFGSGKREQGGSQLILPAMTMVVDLVY